MTRHNTAYIGACLVLVAASLGCSSGSDRQTSPDAGITLTCDLAAPLTCESTTLCSNSTVKVFHGQLPSPAGGRIAVGAYRLGYVLYPDGKGTDHSAEPEDEFSFGASDFLHVAPADPTSVLSGGLGTYTTAGSSMNLSFTSGCSGNGVPLSAFGGCGQTGAVAMPAVRTTVGYTAEQDTISIFRDAPGWPAMYVYYATVNVNGLVRGACESVASEPRAPGDSLQCTSPAFCACAHHEDLAIHCSSSSN